MTMTTMWYLVTFIIITSNLDEKWTNESVYKSSSFVSDAFSLSLSTFDDCSSNIETVYLLLVITWRTKEKKYPNESNKLVNIC